MKKVNISIAYEEEKYAFQIACTAMSSEKCRGILFRR